MITRGMVSEDEVVSGHHGGLGVASGAGGVDVEVGVARLLGAYARVEVGLRGLGGEREEPLPGEDRGDAVADDAALERGLVDRPPATASFGRSASALSKWPSSPRSQCTRWRSYVGAISA